MVAILNGELGRQTQFWRELSPPKDHHSQVWFILVWFQMRRNNLKVDAKWWQKLTWYL